MDRLLKGEDVRVDNLIANEQVVLDSLYAKIKQEKDDIRADFDKQIQLQKDRIQQAKERKDADIAAAQERYKGAFSKKGLDEAIEQAKANELAVASSAQKEILNINNSLDVALSEIDQKYALQISEIQNRIQDLRNQANAKTEDIDVKITELELLISTEQSVVDEIREEKFAYEKEYRKLEAEVGPIKYIAEFIYGAEADRDLLEEAVRWVIIVIIFVFDPLAVLLLIAANFTFKVRYGKSFEEMIGTPKPDNEGGVPSDTYWQERFADMQDQLNRFNNLKEKQETQDDSPSVNYEVKSYEVDLDQDKDLYKSFNISFDETLDLQVKEDKIEEFKKREQEEKKALEEYAQKHQTDIEKPIPMTPAEEDMNAGITRDNNGNAVGNETIQPKPHDNWEIENIEIKDLSDPDLKKKT